MIEHTLSSNCWQWYKSLYRWKVLLLFWMKEWPSIFHIIYTWGSTYLSDIYTNVLIYSLQNKPNFTSCTKCIIGWFLRFSESGLFLVEFFHSRYKVRNIGNMQYLVTSTSSNFTLFTRFIIYGIFYLFSF